MSLRAIALVAGWSAAACGGGGSLPAETIESHEYSLVYHSAERCKIVRERGKGEDDKVKIGSFSPMYAPLPPALGLPAIEMPPPAEVVIQVLDYGPEAKLRFAAGVAAAGYIGEARQIRFEAEFEGELLYEREVLAQEGIPDPERGWHWGEFPVAGGGKLVLRTSSSGPETVPTRAGFGMLEIVVPLEVERTRSSKKRPNVIMVLVDTLRADRIHTYGGEKDITPELDRMAREGTLFERPYSASPWTVPSTTAVLVGNRPHEQNTFARRIFYLDGERLTLAEIFRDEGVTTAAWMTNPLVGLARNFDQGFDFWEEPAGQNARAVMDRAEPWLRERKDERFFLYLHLYDTHGPTDPEEDLARELIGEEPPDFTRRYRSMMERSERGEPVDKQVLARYRKHALDIYDAEIAGVDRQIGRLRALLEELGLADKTVLAFTSDHGEEFLEHSMQGHSKQLYDESVLVPLILVGPGVPVGRRVSWPVENRFLGPTLLDLAGIPARAQLAGKNLLELEGPPEEPILLSTDLGRWRVPGEEGRYDLLKKVDIFSAEKDGKRLMLSPGENRDWAPGDELGEHHYRFYDLNGDPGAKWDVKGKFPEDVRFLRLWLESQLEKVQRRDRTSGEFIEAMGYADEVE